MTAPTIRLNFGRAYMRPAWERIRGPYGTSFWYVNFLGVSISRDTLPPQTVGERGAW